jgi:hypothetical protein
VSPQPSEQDIKDYLDGYNRLSKSWTRNSESTVAKTRGLCNYEKWFKSHGIALYWDQRSDAWKVGTDEQNRE